MTKLAYIGLGLMGTPMARRLLADGHTLAVWNRNRDKLAPLVERGAVAAATPAEAARGAEMVMMCVTDAATVDSVVFGEGGIAAGIGKDKPLIDFSSIAPTRRGALLSDSRASAARIGSMRRSRAASLAPTRARSPSWPGATRPPSTARVRC
jgi:3-hydroxyisobutyrate dehydrogenase-like beta-hydroxyacid dehydrogenase